MRLKGLLLLILLIAAPAYAVDEELRDLTEITNPSSGDLMYVVHDPLTTPIDRKVTLENMLTALTVTRLGNTKEGNGSKIQMFTGSDPNTDDCAKFDSNHNLVTSGLPCGGAAPGSNTQLLYNTSGILG